MGKALLIIVLGFSVVFGGIMLNVTSNQQRASAVISNYYEKWLAQNAASSATNIAISRLFQDFNWKSGYANLSFGGANYSVTIATLNADSVTEAKKLQITTTATYGSESDTSVVGLMQPAYSYYAYFVDHWPDFVTYSTGDTLHGPIHSNEKIRIGGNPVFLSKVSSNQDSYEEVHSSQPQFFGGLELGIDKINLPNLNALKDSALTDGDVYDEEVWLQFQADGSYACSTATLLGTKSISDYNGTIRTTNGKDIHVRGIVNGKVTVVSDDDIYIENDIIYASDPRTNPNSDDFLGLIADKKIIIPDDPAITPDIEIHAAMLALETFEVKDYDKGAPRGTLTLLGSLILKRDKQPGTVSGSILQTGFDRVQVYDARLIDKTPPFFPRLERKEILFRSH